jgi:hypothetical protein
MRAVTAYERRDAAGRLARTSILTVINARAPASHCRPSAACFSILPTHGVSHPSAVSLDC